jgi:hypothetical protein
LHSALDLPGILRVLHDSSPHSAPYLIQSCFCGRVFGKERLEIGTSIVSTAGTVFKAFLPGALSNGAILASREQPLSIGAASITIGDVFRLILHAVVLSALPRNFSSHTSLFFFVFNPGCCVDRTGLADQAAVRNNFSHRSSPWEEPTDRRILPHPSSTGKEVE